MLFDHLSGDDGDHVVFVERNDVALLHRFGIAIQGREQSPSPLESLWILVPLSGRDAADENYGYFFVRQRFLSLERLSNPHDAVLAVDREQSLRSIKGKKPERPFTHFRQLNLFALDRN